MEKYEEKYRIRRVIRIINELLYGTRNVITNKDIVKRLSSTCEIDQQGCDKIHYKDSEDFFDRNYKGVIKKAWREIRKCLKDNGQSELIESKKGREKTYGYPENLTIDPGLEILEKDRKNVRKEFLEILCDSADLLPKSWLASLNIQEDENYSKIIQFDTATLRNQELIPQLYGFIKEKKVISFDYEPFGKAIEKVCLSPHLLKEYNLRWFVFGIVNNRKGVHAPSIYALDRISSIIPISNESYQECETDYNHYFDNIIGVTKIGNKEQEIVLQVDDPKALNYICTKKLHPSQIVQDNSVILNLIPNYELDTRILEYADRLKILKPYEVRNRILERAKQIIKKQSE